MTLEERRKKLKSFIECLKCEVSGKECDVNCPTQYEAGAMGEVIENLECILGILECVPCDYAISRLEALKIADELKADLPDDDHLADMAMAHNEGVLEYQTKLSLLPPVKLETMSGENN